MFKRSIFVLFIGLLVGLLTVFSPSQGQAKTQRLRLSTATMGGTWYPMGVGFGNIVTDNLNSEGITVTGISSAGSIENLNMLSGGETEMAMLIGFLGKMSWEGSGKFEGKPFKGMRSILALQTNVRHDVILADKVKTGTFDDIEGLHYNMGAAGSGAEQTITIILKALGIKIKAEHLGYNQAVQAIKDRRLDGSTFAAVPPVSAVTNLYTSPTKVALLEFTQAHLDRINSVLDAWIMLEIPANTYPGQTKLIQTLGEPTFIACRAEIDDEIIYKVLKAFYSNIDVMAKVHARGKTFFQNIQGLPIPLHPGAIRYWKEKGFKLPEHLTKQP